MCLQSAYGHSEECVCASVPCPHVLCVCACCVSCVMWLYMQAPICIHVCTPAHVCLHLPSVYLHCVVLTWRQEELIRPRGDTGGQKAGKLQGDLAQPALCPASPMGTQEWSEREATQGGRNTLFICRIPRGAPAGDGFSTHSTSVSSCIIKFQRTLFLTHHHTTLKGTKRQSHLLVPQPLERKSQARTLVSGKTKYSNSGWFLFLKRGVRLGDKNVFSFVFWICFF